MRAGSPTVSNGKAFVGERTPFQAKAIMCEIHSCHTPCHEGNVHISRCLNQKYVVMETVSMILVIDTLLMVGGYLQKCDLEVLS